MKKPLFALLVIVAIGAMFSCSNHVQPRDVSSAAYAPIGDFTSRVSQYKMRTGRAQYGLASTGILLLHASIPRPTYNEYYKGSLDSTFTMPRLFKKIKLHNRSGFPVYADLITAVTVDGELSCSVRKITLQRNEKLSVLLAFGEEYELHYSFEEDATDVNRFSFLAGSGKTLRITDKGIDR